MVADFFIAYPYPGSIHELAPHGNPVMARSLRPSAPKNLSPDPGNQPLASNNAPPRPRRADLPAIASAKAGARRRRITRVPSLKQCDIIRLFPTLWLEINHLRGLIRFIIIILIVILISSHSVGHSRVLCVLLWQFPDPQLSRKRHNATQSDFFRRSACKSTTCVESSARRVILAGC